MLNMSSFIPRTTFAKSQSLPKSYFLGHHHAGFSKMQNMLSSIDLVIECRDYRVPLTSQNPLFEGSLAGRQRLIVYTKRDLGSDGKPSDRRREDIIRSWHQPTSVIFTDYHNRKDVRKVHDFARKHGEAINNLTGSRMLIVGMPNVGKSSMINALRSLGVGGGKVARTGAQPGVTRKIATAVKIVDTENDEERIYLVDTPGVFIPYVPDGDSMLKLALCGCVKDTIISPITLADYLLYHINLVDPSLYSAYSQATNEIMTLLDAISSKTGRLKKGGIPDVEASALWFVQRWRQGQLGHFMLDEVSTDAMEKRILHNESLGGSLSSAIRQAKQRSAQERINQRAESNQL